MLTSLVSILDTKKALHNEVKVPFLCNLGDHNLECIETETMKEEC